ncbi:hypothetical protein Dsin_016626 [Dipteronia sinensis]|uniref:Uncharacterized protein n=1 Tax=Dipteronia sinensis TaxID=43782 RepID=A0AAE0ADF7_9ROSI|nr:hypothetical protein Dsin_016626 [Dipteronia sinensis]
MVHLWALRGLVVVVVSLETVESFVNGCFAIPLGQFFPFEVELLAASFAINFAWKYMWHQIWFEGALLMWFSFFLPVFRWIVMCGNIASSRSRRWIFRFPIFSRRGIVW